jgi:hypothetical protein
MLYACNAGQKWTRSSWFPSAQTHTRPSWPDPLIDKKLLKCSSVRVLCARPITRPPQGKANKLAINILVVEDLHNDEDTLIFSKNKMKSTYPRFVYCIMNGIHSLLRRTTYRLSGRPNLLFSGNDEQLRCKETQRHNTKWCKRRSLGMPQNPPGSILHVRDARIYWQKDAIPRNRAADKSDHRDIGRIAGA